jgi:microsomal dipeptidase-like Zn-dependent dipeptidase
MPIFDAHIHPIFKPYLSNGKNHIWEELPGVSFLKSQGSMSHMQKGNIELAVVALFPIERAFSTRILIQLLGSVLKPFVKDKLNDIMAKDYFDMIWEELKMIYKSPRKKEFKVLTKMSEIEAGNVNIVFSIERAHALLGKRSFEVNLLKLKENKKYRFFSLNLTHLAQADFVNHAFGSKMFKGNDEFKPNGNGITDDGFKVIKLALNKSKGQRIIIDIKHMSLLARKQYYEYVKGKKIPLLASHASVTGMSWRDIHKHINGACTIDQEFVEVKYKAMKGIGDTRFNPWSINLYDEEIKMIIDSGGLLGLNLDQRIQGHGKLKGEYFSIHEFRHVVNTQPLTIKLKESTLIEPPEEKAFNVKKHLRYLSNVILHIVRIGGKDAWNHICFGSDFDGMINPLNCCQNAAEYPNFITGLMKTLPDMIEKAKRKYPGSQYFEENLGEKVHRMSFQNSFDFVKKHF